MSHVISADYVNHDPGHAYGYSGRYDRLYCLTCDEWVEPPCGCGPVDQCPFEQAPGRPSESGELRSEPAAKSTGTFAAKEKRP